MIRIPISLHRVPIISRTAIFRRKAVCSTPVKCIRCKLCVHNKDCSGRDYVNISHGEDIPESKSCRVIHIENKDYNWEEIEQTIWGLETQGVLLRLLLDRDIPTSVLWAASYNAKNIIQINMNMFRYQSILKWALPLMAQSYKCGAYAVVCMYPIVPTVIKSWYVLDVIDVFRSYGYVHYSLKFAEMVGGKANGDYFNYNGLPVPTEYLTETSSGRWACTPEFIQLFLEKIQPYITSRKVSLSVCGQTEDCTGLEVKKNEGTAKS